MLNLAPKEPFVSMEMLKHQQSVLDKEKILRDRELALIDFEKKLIEDEKREMKREKKKMEANNQEIADDIKKRDLQAEVDKTALLKAERLNIEIGLRAEFEKTYNDKLKKETLDLERVVFEKEANLKRQKKIDGDRLRAALESEKLAALEEFRNQLEIEKREAFVIALRTEEMKISKRKE
jgi:hypothetical protein